MKDIVLVIGGGGREHALAWKLAQSGRVSHVYVAPGNAGTDSANKTSNVDIDMHKHEEVISWCHENSVAMVIVGPEAPLSEGLADSLNKQGIPCFGPSAQAAQIEASKVFAKDFMQRWDIPTAQWQAFSHLSQAQAYINSLPYDQVVVKASGLAAGKGVIICNDKKAACDAALQMMQDKIFGLAGETVIVEEYLEGEEVSCLAFTDGTALRMMPPVQDHKRLLEGDQGPNTGGMGAYCPCPLVSEKDLEKIRSDILQKTVDGLRQEGRIYKGVLYAGLMLTKDGPKVLEFNCRFGDPETQVLLPLMTSDLYEMTKACVSGTLQETAPTFHTGSSAVAVVLVSQGYPGQYKKNMPITGLNHADLTQLVFHAGTKRQDGTVVTSGGRVLAVVAMDTDIKKAACSAQHGARLISFTGKNFREDIAHKVVGIPQILTYQGSGVDIKSADVFVSRLKPLAEQTFRRGCVSGLGMFGAGFDLKKETNFRDPILVSGTDGVGTKLKVAQTCGLHSTIGIDLVAMCVNDVLCHGAEPLYFLDYFACGKLNAAMATNVLHGVIEGCRRAGCALTGGETAEMPGVYAPGDYDLAGFTVGAVEREKFLPQLHTIYNNDHVIGVASSGLHSNGFSLVRQICEKKGHSYTQPAPFQKDMTLGEILLKPTEIYVKPILTLLRQRKVKALAHITGGGLPGNVSRILPPGTGVTLDAERWEIAPVFGWLASQGNVSADEMARTFNCGLGLVMIIDSQENPDIVCDILQREGYKAWAVGRTRPIDPDAMVVTIGNMKTALERSLSTSPTERPVQASNGHMTNGTHPEVDMEEDNRKRVAVLISGSGTNLKALIDNTQNPALQSSSKICLVISNKAGVKGLDLAKAAGIPTKVISHKEFRTRDLFDAALHQVLVEAEVDIVCLAGFMRILTGEFVRKWEGRMLNIHPSLLPSFKGANAHEQAIASKVRISGCTVHFVAEEVDTGAILVQESVPVYPSDTIDSLAERVKSVEHVAFPRALELVASGQAKLKDGAIDWK